MAGCLRGARARAPQPRRRPGKLVPGSKLPGAGAFMGPVRTVPAKRHPDRLPPVRPAGHGMMYQYSDRFVAEVVEFAAAQG